jgi:hypothetical protein
MKPTNDQIAASRFVTRNTREKDALAEWIVARLRQRDEDAQDGWRPAANTDMHARRKYAIAKFSARCRDLEQLRIIFVNTMRYPEIAEFIAEPCRPKGRQRRPQLTLKQSIARWPKGPSLAHTIGSDVEKAYRSSDFFEKRRRLMQGWAKFCSSSRQAGVITPLGSRV